MARFLVRSWRYVRPFWRKSWHWMGWKKAGRNETNISKKHLSLFHRTFPHPMWSYPSRSYTFVFMINFKIDTYSSKPTNAKSDRSKQQHSSTLNLSHWQTRDNTSTNWGRRLQRQLLNYFHTYPFNFEQKHMRGSWARGYTGRHWLHNHVQTSYFGFGAGVGLTNIVKARKPT